MDALSDYTSPVIEFKAVNNTEKLFKLIDNSTETEPLPLKVDAIVATCTKRSQETQTKDSLALATDVDDRKLANWLQTIYEIVKKELVKGCTPILASHSSQLHLCDVIIQPYQKLKISAAANCQGLATWLSVCTNNAPIVVVTTSGTHDDWCEHVDQYLKLFVPKRMVHGNFVTYNEEKSVPIKACLRSLCTNPFNKNIFAGSTFDGDIYVWQYEQHYRNHANNGNGIEVNEIYHTTLPYSYGYAVALDWTTEDDLLTAHSNGNVVEWHLSKNTGILKVTEYKIQVASIAAAEICTLLALDVNNFVVGTKDGSVFHCKSSGLFAVKRHLEIVALKEHLFMVSTLLKTHINGYRRVVSCDLSGQVYFHDLRNSNDHSETIVAQIPLPFTNTITCSRDGSVIYYPGDDGGLECYRLSDGSQNTVKGALKGKGNFIKSSDNGCWLITGLYEEEFQIFSVDL